MTDAAASPQIAAAEITGRLWAALKTAGITKPGSAGRYRQFPGAFAPPWLASLPLPVAGDRPGSQPVALLDDRPDFERHHDQAQITAAYQAHPRTQVYEDIGHDAPGTWHALAGRHLGRLARCTLSVPCSVFASRAGDESLGAHYDTWHGVIIQMTGTKTWQIGSSLLTSAGPPPRTVTTRPGDILLISKYLPHKVTTPADPGYSVHITYALHRDTPEQAAQHEPQAPELGVPGR